MIMKKYTIITTTVIGIVLGFLTGLYLYKINSIDNKKTEIIAQEIEDDCTSIAKFGSEELANTVETNNKQEKTSPNCKIILKVYYEKCEHIIETKKNIEEADVNITEDELQEKFPEWEIQRFTPNEIVLYKEVDENCNEHFLLKDQEGYIAIYKLDENNNAEFFQTTEISTDYLAEKDLTEIQNGIRIYTEKELNKTLEDFE